MSASRLRRLGSVLMIGGLAAGLATFTGPAATADPLADLAATPGLLAEFSPTTAASTWAFGAVSGRKIDPNIEFGNLVPTITALAGRSTDVAGKWSGNITVPADGTYTFSYRGDNGARLSVGGTQVINHWVNDWDKDIVGTPVTLTAGTHAFSFDWFQATGGAHATLSWSGPGFDKQVVPASAFTLADGIAPVTATIDAEGDDLVLDFPQDLASFPSDAAGLKLLSGGSTLPVTSATIDPTDRSKVNVEVGIPFGQEKAAASTIRFAGTNSATYVGGTGVGIAPVVVDNQSTQVFMATPWTDDVDPTNPLPEYPRPQLARADWQSLNGIWQFEGATSTAAPAFGEDLDGEIVVPYAMESQLSGVIEHHDQSVYRRTFTVPADWNVGSGQRLQLHFGAVDYKSWVYVNGELVKTNEGGYNGFSADVTDALDGTGEQELVVVVEDTTAQGQPKGKQVPVPYGIFYVPTSGIWQTVWMEPTPVAAIDDLELRTTGDATGDVPTGTITATVESSGTGPATVIVSTNGEVVATGTGVANEPIEIDIPDAHLWSPDDPFLYDITASFGEDDVLSYAGLRSFDLININGQDRIALNGKTLYLQATLDQGYWPDGVLTAPTDEALAWDIQATKDLGFNSIRKHIKVEPDRWYYWADRIGMVVWQDMPTSNNGGGYKPTDAQQAEFERQLQVMVDEHDSMTSIGVWVSMNEAWGEYSPAKSGEVAEKVKQWDPTRLVDAHSGFEFSADSGKGDLADRHAYPGPATVPSSDGRASVDGEHGGLAYIMEDRRWAIGTEQLLLPSTSKQELTDKFVATQGRLLNAPHDNLSGAIYTQITDVEAEVNGFYTYDRQVLKMDKAAAYAANRAVIDKYSNLENDQIEYVDLNELGRWKLDETAGAVANDSVGEHDGTVLGNPSWVAGKAGNALQLNGTNQQVDLGAPIIDTGNSFTVSSWVKLDRTNGFFSAVTVDGTPQSSFFLQFSNEDKAFAFSVGTGRAVAKGVGLPQTGRWYQLTGVYDAQSNQLKLYVDGQLAGTKNTPRLPAATGNLVIGRAKWQGNPVDFWPGAIDDVRVFEGAVTDAQALSLFQDTVAPTTTAVVADADPAVVTLTATDNELGSGVALTQYRVGGQAWSTYTGPVSVTRTAAAQTFEFRSVDAAGNEETVRSVVIPAGSVVTPPPAEATTATACLAGKSVLTVRVRATGTVAQTLTATSAFGTKTWSNVAPKGLVIHNFVTPGKTVPAGEVTITSVAADGGQSLGTITLQYPARTCS